MPFWKLCTQCCLTQLSITICYGLVLCCDMLNVSFACIRFHPEFLAGRCLMHISVAREFKLASHISLNSSIRGKLGVALMPGSALVQVRLSSVWHKPSTWVPPSELLLCSNAASSQRQDRLCCTFVQLSTSCYQEVCRCFLAMALHSAHAPLSARSENTCC